MQPRKLKKNKKNKKKNAAKSDAFLSFDKTLM